MGDYSVHCALSGIPIRNGNPVVGWRLQHSKFKTIDENMFIPLSLPVHGFYDNGGGIEDKDGNNVLIGDGMVAICHESLWNTLPDFWNPLDGDGPVCEGMTKSHEKYLKEIKMHQELLASLKESDEQYEFWKCRATELYGAAHMALSSHNMKIGCILKWIDKLYLGEPSKDDETEEKDKKKWPHADHFGTFERLILDVVIAGPSMPNFDQTCIDIGRLIMAYSSTYYRGRPILPTQATHAEQYPDFKREKKWFQIVAKKVNELRANEVAQEKKNKAEEAEFMKIYEAKQKENT